MRIASTSSRLAKPILAKPILAKPILAKPILAKPLFLSLILLATLSVCSTVFADATETKPAPVDVAKTMDKARSLIADGKLKQATKQLQKVVKEDKDNADAWNLLGYSWRKLDQNKKSAKSYKRALKIDSNHKGALEYQGELFIKTGESEKAEANLEKLKTLCPDGCEELDNLSAALTGKSSY